MDTKLGNNNCRTLFGINPAIVSPGNPIVIPLEPEFVVQQDGDKKQDCENKAMKRWLSKWSDKYKNEGFTALGDDLFAKDSICKKVIEAVMHFLFVCKPLSHKYIYEMVESFRKSNDLSVVERKEWTGKQYIYYQYRFLNNILIKNDDEALKVNWLDITITDSKGRQKYHNGFITDYEITEETVIGLATDGRCRWKIENEVNNTLKTKGYHLEHNFGHGKKNLCRVLLSLNLIAFLFHNILELTENPYGSLRKRLPTRKAFFQHISVLSCYLCFESWWVMIAYMLKSLDNPQPPPADNIIRNSDYLSF